MMTEKQMHIQSTEVHEHEEQVIETPGIQGQNVVMRVIQLVWLAFGLLEALIGFRVFLKLLSANPGNLFAQAVYRLSEVFLLPFFGLTITPSAEGVVLEIPSIIAMAVYAVIAWACVRLIWILFYRPVNRKVVGYQRDRM